MDLQSKADALDAELREKIALRDRAVQAANDATLQIARLEGAIGVVRELLEQARGES